MAQEGREGREALACVGQVLGGTYRLERVLTTGGMGTVYLGRHLRTGGLVAIKVMHRHFSSQATRADLDERFRDEARISCALRHPNVVQVMDLAEDEAGTPYMAMELLEGEDLQDRLDREGRLPLSQALDIVRQVGSALYAAHCQGVVHRDLKPQNIFLATLDVFGGAGRVGGSPDGGPANRFEQVKLLDFGLSKKPRAQERATKDLLILGTPRYLAPEAAQGQNSQLDGRADQFSLAVILYRALSGRLPFDGDDVAEVLHKIVYSKAPPLADLVPGLPPQVAQAVERALAKRKEDRFDTVMEFVAALQRRDITRRIPDLAAARRDDGLRLLPPARAGLWAGLGALLMLPPLLLLDRWAWTGAGHPARHGPRHGQGPGRKPAGTGTGTPQGPRPAPPPPGPQGKAKAAPAGRTIDLQEALRAAETLPLLRNYPPLRLEDAGAGQEQVSAVQVLRDAQHFYEQGKYGRAIERAHLLLGKADRQATYRLLGAAACAAGRLDLFGDAYERLDPQGRERLIADCRGARPDPR